MVSQIDEFEVLEELGRGAMGVVYRAVDPAQRAVAIKVMALAAQARPDSVARFERECQAASRLDHPNIIKVLRLGLHGSYPYMAMELVEGEDLDAHILAHGPIPPRRAAELGLQIASALHHAHERQVIHRDLKPANVMLHPTRGALLTDFGLAKVFSSQDVGLTRSSDLLGSPAYMAPEQATADHARVGTRTDVYGLGTILYEMLSGKPPCWGSSLQEVMHAVVEVVPPPPSHLVPAVGPALDAICMKCLAKDPDDRFACADDVALALDAYLLDPDAAPGAAVRSPLLPLLASVVVVLGVLLTLLVQRQAEESEPEFAGVPSPTASTRTEPSPLPPPRSSVPTPPVPPPPSVSRPDLARLLQAILSNAPLPPADLERWLTAARAALAREPSSAAAHVDLALVQLALMKPDLALVTVKRALQLAPDDVAANRTWGLIALRCRPSKNQDAVRAFTRTLQLAPNDLLALRGRGVAFTNLKQYSKANGDFDRWIERAPTVKAYGCRAYSRTLLQQYAGAKADYAAAIQLDPNHHDSYANLAELFRITGDAPSAVKNLERCLQLRPQQVDLREQLTKFLFQLEAYSRTITSAKELERIAPTNPIGLLYQALAHMKLAQDGAAFDALQRLVRREPAYLPGLLSLAQVQMTLESWAAVVQTCDRIRALSPNPTVAIKVEETRAKACMKLKDMTAAIDSLRRVLAVDPNNREALLLLVQVHHELKRWASLLKTCDRLLAMTPPLPKRVLTTVRAARAVALKHTQK